MIYYFWLKPTNNQVSLRFCLHGTLAFSGGKEAVSCLIQGAADVNERLRIPMSRTSLWSFVKVLQVIHHFSASALTVVAHHHSGATPLMLSILTGKFETVPILLAAGARWDIPNDRGTTPADLLRRMPASVSTSNLRLNSDEDSDDTISF